MQTSVSAIASQNVNVVSQTNNALTALEKVEDRKRKLESEISLSTNEDDESKKTSIVAKLDQKIAELYESLQCCFSPRLRTFVSLCC